MLAPQSLMAAIPTESLRPGIAQSAMMTKYGQEIDRDSAYEMLTRKLEVGAQAAEQERMAQEAARQQAGYAKQRVATVTQAERERAEAERRAAAEAREAARTRKATGDAVDTVPRSGSAMDIVRGIFGTARWKRRAHE